MMIFIAWLLLSILIGVWAGNWGRSGLLYGFGALIVSPLIMGLILLIQGKDQSNVEQNELADGTNMKCPECAEIIKAEAKKCRFCGSAVGAAPAKSDVATADPPGRWDV